MKEIRGYLDESKGTGTGYDVAVYDFDGDGEAERRGSEPLTIDYGGGRMEKYRQPAIQFQHGGADWWVWLETVESGMRVGKDGTARIGFSWSASTDGGFAHFINGTFRAYTDAKAAQAAKPVRIGKPLGWVLGSRKRGPRAVVTAALSDGNGAWLRIADCGDGEVRAAVRILETGKDLVGEYG